MKRKMVVLALAAGMSVPAFSQVVFNETFGSTAVRKSSDFVPQYSTGGTTVSYYKYADPALPSTDPNADGAKYILDGFYAVINPRNIYDLKVSATDNNPLAGDWWKRGAEFVWSSTKPADVPGFYTENYNVFGGVKWYTTFNVAGNANGYKDADGNPDGAVLVVNAGNVLNEIYRRIVTLEPGKTYSFSSQVLYVQSPGTVNLMVQNADGTDVQPSPAIGTPYSAPNRNALLFPASPPPDGTAGPAATWETVGYKFKVDPACSGPGLNLIVALSNLDKTSSGNDLFVDNIKLESVADDSSVPVICGQAVTKVAVATAGPDLVTTPMNKAVTIDVKGNDSSSQPSDAPLGLPHVDGTSKPKPDNGTVLVNSAGTITYTPNPGFVGTDTFTYEVCTTISTTYPTPHCAEATVTVTVYSPDPPVLAPVDDGATTPKGTAVTINLTVNDSSSDPVNAPVDPATVAEASKPTNGTVTYNSDGSAVYTPNAGFVGNDSFQYQVCTKATIIYPATACKTATVNVVVTGSTLQVTAGDDSGTTSKDTPVTINVIGNDQSSDSTNAPLNKQTTEVTPPANGKVTYHADGTVTYTPNAGYLGSDSFEYQVCTEATAREPVKCAKAKVTIQVGTSVTPGDGAVAVPTLGQWALMLLSTMLAGFAARRLRRRVRAE